MIPLPSPQQLRYLLALSERQHFGHAAQSCAVTQSTLSAGILALERQLDVHILDRTAGKRVVFTPLGNELVARAHQAVAALEAVTEAATAARAPMSGPLRLGVIPTIGPFLLPRLMPALREAFPRLRLFLREDTTERLTAGLAANRLDVLLLALPCACGGAETLRVQRDPFVVCLPRGHRLAALDRISPDALRSERVLLLEDGHCLRDQALAVCGRGEGAGGTGADKDEFAATTLHTLVQMAAGGLGITVLPRLAVAAGVTAGAQAEIVLRPLEGGWRTLGLAWRRNAPRSAEYRSLAAILARAAEAAGAGETPEAEAEPGETGRAA